MSRVSDSEDSSGSCDVPTQAHQTDRQLQNNQNGNGDLRPDSQQRQTASAPNEGIPLSKRIACVACRKRKLRCDGGRPTCATCSRRNYECVYEETRKKSGPKRSYVKHLEQRLAHVEGLLTSKVNNDGQASVTSGTNNNNNNNKKITNTTPLSVSSNQSNDTFTIPNIPPVSHSPSYPSYTQSPLVGQLPRGLPNQLDSQFGNIDLNFSTASSLSNSDGFWDMISLGMEEPLPPQEIIDAVHEAYFSISHVNFPMIHRSRYISAIRSPEPLQPPIYLRYAIWMTGALASPKLRQYAQIFYNRTRKYLEQIQLKGFGEHIGTISYTQAWILVCQYEFSVMFFPRAWLSAGMACRSTLMLQCNVLDTEDSGLKHCLPPPKDWIEKEERRRTFWAAFCCDQYASIATGWPLALDELDIMTNLPASSQAFETGKKEETCKLSQVFESSGSKHIKRLSLFAHRVLTVSLFGRIHYHLHRGDSRIWEIGRAPPGFLERYRYIDNSIHLVMLALPSEYKSQISMSASLAAVMMCLHAATICLHQATAYRIRKSTSHESLFNESRTRCLHAASEIAKLMQMCCHYDSNTFDSFMVFCIYLAARCFIQAMKASPESSDYYSKQQLDFLLTALENTKDNIFIAQSFLLQLEIDMANMSESASCMQDDNSPISRSSVSEPPSLDSQNSSPADAQRDINIGISPAAAADYFKNPPGRTLNSQSVAWPDSINVQGRQPIETWPSENSKVVLNDVSIIDNLMASNEMGHLYQKNNNNFMPQQSSNPVVSEQSGFDESAGKCGAFGGDIISGKPVPAVLSSPAEVAKKLEMLRTDRLRIEASLREMQELVDQQQHEQQQISLGQESFANKVEIHHHEVQHIFAQSSYSQETGSAAMSISSSNMVTSNTPNDAFTNSNMNWSPSELYNDTTLDGYLQSTRFTQN
ncbi:fungal-specific transcription factor domain-containing protein [Lipomyces japonicus]|uniref:fungal-specific transcription factor domain-containing protein n=1 Tax=Lipomyces japonicus TaxID=56871 RepID=UPI0034CF2DCE